MTNSLTTTPSKIILWISLALIPVIIIAIIITISRISDPFIEESITPHGPRTTLRFLHLF